jgi:hypothetical protein
MVDDDIKVEDVTTESTSDETETTTEDINYSEDVLTPEEQELQEGKLARKRDAESRIQQLVAKNKELETKLIETEQARQVQYPTPPVQTSIEQPLNPEVQKAVDFLKDQGFVTKKDVVTKEEYSQEKDRFALDQAHIRLENQFDGSDGRPKYDKESVEHFMRTNGVYNPQIAYEQLNKSELLDFELKNAQVKVKNRPYIERPGNSVSEHAISNKTITREKVEKAMQTPEGRNWYERNRNKILDLYQKGLL